MTLRRDPLAKTPIAEITHTNLPLLNRFVSHDNPYARMHTHTQSPPDWHSHPSSPSCTPCSRALGSGLDPAPPSLDSPSPPLAQVSDNGSILPRKLTGVQEITYASTPTQPLPLPLPLPQTLTLTLTPPRRSTYASIPNPNPSPSPNPNAVAAPLQRA